MDENLDNKQIIMFLDLIFNKVNSLEEKINCIQHSICKNSDEKTFASIRKFLTSNFRNRTPPPGN